MLEEWNPRAMGKGSELKEKIPVAEGEIELRKVCREREKRKRVERSFREAQTGEGPKGE